MPFLLWNTGIPTPPAPRHVHAGVVAMAKPVAALSQMSWVADVAAGHPVAEVTNKPKPTAGVSVRKPSARVD